jgi:23S rRNA pseudouridine1911/1915/1917 synthase
VAQQSDSDAASNEEVEEARERVVPESLAGVRLDKALAALLPELSRARIKRAVEIGAVRVNGRRMPKGGSVAAGDVVRIEVTKIADVPPLASDGPLRVAFETEQIVVVDKPPGQPTAPLRPGETGTLVNALLGRYPELVPKGPSDYFGHALREPGIVHRLDTETSGALLVARTAPAFEELRAALKEGKLDKSYLLVCAESGLPDDGVIDVPLANHPKDQRRVYACIHPRDVMRYQPRSAVTRYHVVERAGIWALVEARASKALRHQLRAHFAAIGHPLAGDELYGGSVIRSLGRQALHASKIGYAGGAIVGAFEVEVPLPKDIRSLLANASSS